MSEGKHFHCPKCNRVCRERSVTVNHVWRCMQAEKIPLEDDPIDIDDAEDYGLEESLLKVHCNRAVTIFQKRIAIYCDIWEVYCNNTTIYCLSRLF